MAIRSKIFLLAAIATMASSASLAALDKRGEKPTLDPPLNILTYPYRLRNYQCNRDHHSRFAEPCVAFLPN